MRSVRSATARKVGAPLVSSRTDLSVCVIMTAPFPGDRPIGLQQSILSFISSE